MFNFDTIEKRSSQEIYVALFSIIDKGTFENDPIVLKSAIDLLINLLNSHSTFGKLEEPELQMELQNHTDSIIDNLFLKLAHENNFIHEHSRIGLKKLSNYNQTSFRK